MLGPNHTRLGSPFDLRLGTVSHVSSRITHNRRLTCCPPVGLDRSVGVFQLNVLMAHQCPSGQVGPVELHRSFKVPDGLLVFRPQRIVVPYSTIRHVSSPRLNPHQEVQESHRRGNRLLAGPCQFPGTRAPILRV